MPVQVEDFGPIDPVFNLQVVQILQNSPTRQQSDCLRDLFGRLRRGRIQVHVDRVGRTINIFECDHVIELLNNGGRVERIYPDFTSP
jgi:hypothetical protein